MEIEDLRNAGRPKKKTQPVERRIAGINQQMQVYGTLTSKTKNETFFPEKLV